ncbi:MAG: malate dehydrogenase (oxaloacetate-decarboxylating)(NADP+) [Gammaproteobacteria bacterium]|jgi:malate dehydrogenase (oxaloacetate-decarboxylating)(NADP+)
MKKNQLTGTSLLQNPRFNKGTAFTLQERVKYKLRGLLPKAVNTLKEQQARVLKSIRRKENDMERYIFLAALQARNETLYYRVVIDNIEELMPIIYTPTVGQACIEFGDIYREARGCYICTDDKGQVGEILDCWPEEDVRLIVVTDGERILGLGDLGANGMGIPIGKLALYCACAGIAPHQCLPVMLDVGTNNEKLLNDPLYLGIKKNRTTGDAYLSLVDEFIIEVQKKYPAVLIQFEDFLTPNAYKLLNIYRNKVLCFNDDIEGTAAVVLAGVYASTRISKLLFKDLRIMFLGAGSAATGIGDLIYAALREAGLYEKEARRRLWFSDSKGLIVKSRENLMSHILPYAHENEAMSFQDAIQKIKPHILIGATGSPGTFTCEIIESMSEINSRPAIFALSNPTSRAECTAEQAYTWSKGKAIFASGSPFSEVEYEGIKFVPGQGNNAYVFPGIGLGALACSAKLLTDEIFLVAAKTLSELVTDDDLNNGTIYPPLTSIREVSFEIAVAVAEKSYADGNARIERPDDLRKIIKESMYDPNY